MYSDQQFMCGNPIMPPFPNQARDYHMQNPPSIKPFSPFHGVDFQPSECCPRNFIIFDRTDNRSQILFHPETNSKFFNSGFGFFQPNLPDKQDASSFSKVDSDDIDALLSTDYEESEETDDEVSTARTNGSYSPDTCSSYESVSRTSRKLYRKSCGGSHSSDKKRQKVRKMVKALKGIVPGANRMSTVAVLDEAVRYFKSLRVEVKKLGVRNVHEGYA